MRIECPICEYQLQYDEAPDSSTIIRCHSCSKSFSFDPSLVITSGQTAPTAQTTPTKTLDHQALPTAKITRDRQVTPPPSNPANAETATPSDQPTTTLSPIPLSPIDRQRRRKTIKQALLVASLGIMAAVLVGLITFSDSIRQVLNDQNDQNELNQNKPTLPDEILPTPLPLSPSDEKSLAPVNQSDNTKLEQRKTDLSELNRQIENLAKSELKPAITYTEPKTGMVSKNTMRDTWEQVQPHLVELTAETAFGPAQATGILIDSRGWVLSSYRALQGAKEITVRPSRKSIQDPENELTDLVRGVIASDPAHDLVILKVNRRFVTQFRDLPIANQDRIVTRQYLIQCAPPSDSYKWSAVECPIENRKRTSELDQEQQMYLKQAGYLEDPEEPTRWMLHRLPSPLGQGSALINDKGELVGMTVKTTFPKSAKDLCLAVPATHILKLKQSALKKSSETQPAPLPIPSLNRATATNTPTTVGNRNESDQSSQTAPTTHDNLSLLPKTSLRRILSLNLNRAGQVCGQTDWWPKNDTEVANLRLFIDHLITAQRVIEAEPDGQDTPILQKQVDYWWPQLSSGLRPPDGFSQETNSKFNGNYREQQEESTRFVAVGQVYYSLVESPIIDFDTEPNQETVTFKLIGIDQPIIAPSNEDWPVLHRKTECLIVGELLSKHVRIVNQDGEGQEKLDLAKVYFLLPLAPNQADQ